VELLEELDGLAFADFGDDLHGGLK